MIKGNVYMLLVFITAVHDSVRDKHADASFLAARSITAVCAGGARMRMCLGL